MQRLLEIMRQLRAPDGCPWDRKQTHLTLRRYLLEEAAEAVDAIAAGEPGEMADELGDVLLQVAFHAVIAEEAGTFRYEDIEEAIVSKLIRRHPHIFEDVSVSGADEVLSNWQAIKAAERGGREGRHTSPAAAVPRGLPALMRAAEVGKAANWPAPDFSTPPIGEPGDGSAWLAATEEGIGEHLLAVAQYARAHGVDPELALRAAVDAAVAAEVAGAAEDATDGSEDVPEE
ncbi:MAG: MazG family protein [Trueperaceae bacterium]